MILATVMLVSPMVALAQEPSPNLEIWSDKPEMTQRQYNAIRAKACPSPVPDPGNETRYTESGEALYPGRISVTFYGVRPDGTQVTIEQDPPSELCQNTTGFSQPTDLVGEWTFYATATWVSEGEIKSIRSNEISVLVNPPIFQTLEPELLVRNPEFYSVLDWSPDGKYILGAIHSTGGDALGLLDIDSLKVTRLSIEFGQISDARFSASGDAILVLPWTGSGLAATSTTYRTITRL